MPLNLYSTLRDHENRGAPATSAPGSSRMSGLRAVGVGATANVKNCYDVAILIYEVADSVTAAAGEAVASEGSM